MFNNLQPFIDSQSILLHPPRPARGRVLKIEIPKSIEEVIGPKRLTRYEKARLISARAFQLALGATPFIDVSSFEVKDPILIAKRELEEGVLPLTIARKIRGRVKQLIPVKWLLEAERKQEH